MRMSLVVMICAAGLSASGDSKKANSIPSWRVKYKSGALGIKAGRWIRISFAPDTVSEGVTTPVLAITVDQLRRIYFSSKAERESDLLESMPRSGCAYARNLMPNMRSRPNSILLAQILKPGPISRALDHLSPMSPVRFVWTDQSKPVDLLISVNDCEYAPFLANLRWFAGQHSQEVLREFVAK
jgi:hypothetical protein